MPNITAEFIFKRGADTPVAVADRNGPTEEGFLGSLPVLSQTMDLAAMTADHRVQAWGDYCPGVLGVARGDDPDSGNSQFFIERTNDRTRPITGAARRSTRSTRRSAASSPARTWWTRSLSASRRRRRTR